jgi:glycosyltransferase involved in cell wall biosynthesis
MNVALVDWHWQGHHPAYFNYFVLALEELGIGVLALCPDPVKAAETANSFRKNSGLGSSGRLRTKFRAIKVPHWRFPYVRPSRISAIDWAIRHFTGIEKKIEEWKRESGIKTDAVFYACMYDWDFEWVRYAQPFLHLPWQGLYLHAMSFRMPGRPHPRLGRLMFPEKMFGGKRCRGVAILDEGISQQVSKAIGKHVVVLPELTDSAFATNEREAMLAERLKQFAAGRPIIGLFGYLQKSKGILTFLEAARMPAASNICFALGGEMLWPLDRAESNKIQLTLGEYPNIWNHLARIPSESSLNSLMAGCDILFAAYHDFPHSSNIQIKAATLGKPLIVSDGYLMAERVRRYNAGEVIRQGDAQALLDAIFKITKDPAAWVANNQPQWSEYCRENSFERFKSGLAELLNIL